MFTGPWSGSISGWASLNDSLHNNSSGVGGTAFLSWPLAATSTTSNAIQGIEVGSVSLRIDVVNAATEVSVQKNPNAMRAVLWAGFACGVLDITAALVVYGYFGAKPLRLLQGIASGLLGPRPFNGGLATALLGLLCHFLLPFGPATVYFAPYRPIPSLV